MTRIRFLLTAGYVATPLCLLLMRAAVLLKSFANSAAVCNGVTQQDEVSLI